MWPTLPVMLAFKARVRHGRLVLDEPTDLPEGTEIDLVPADDGDELNDEERAALHASLDAAAEEIRAGRLIDGEQVLAELRARRAS